MACKHAPEILRTEDSLNRIVSEEHHSLASQQVSTVHLDLRLDMSKGFPCAGNNPHCAIRNENSFPFCVLVLN
jgi:hypothetical protein